MACIESNEKCFTFHWKLENISHCVQKMGESIESPAFVVNAIDQTKWKLRLYPRGKTDGNYIGYFLRREVDCKGPENIEIKYELAFIAKDGSILHSFQSREHTYGKASAGTGKNRFVKRNEVFISKRSAFLPHDILTTRCKIWKIVGEMTEDVLCIARTRLGAQKVSFLWNLENFSALESEKKYTYEIKSLNSYIPLMSVDLSLTGGLGCGEIIGFDLSLQDQTIKFATLHLSIADASGNRVECNENEFWFNSLTECRQFTLSLTKKKLLAMKNVYLKDDDVLSLHFEWVFCKGIVLEETEEVQYGSSSSEIKIPVLENINNEKEMSIPDTLKDNLKSLYDKQFLCDIKLKINTRVFPAHKIILSASSSIFSAMFSSDMKEKDSDCVNIQDLSEDTVSGMLLYIYTARVEDLSWESASDLYVAADKYDIQSLKNICSSYLKEHLSPRNACEVLLLSDLHTDGDLKSSVQDYILKYIKDIVKSGEWKYLVEINAKLAAETVCTQYN